MSRFRNCEGHRARSKQTCDVVTWEGDVRALLIVMAIALGGCAAQHLNAAQYTRTDGKPVDPAHQQAALAQCKGEAVSAPPDPQCFDCGWKEKTIIAACMARNGYIQAQQ